MIRILMIVFITLIALAVLVQAKLIRMSTPRAEVILVKNYQNTKKEFSYRDFWIKNEHKISSSTQENFSSGPPHELIKKDMN